MVFNGIKHNMFAHNVTEASTVLEGPPFFIHVYHRSYLYCRYGFREYYYNS